MQYEQAAKRIRDLDAEKSQLLRDLADKEYTILRLLYIIEYGMDGYYSRGISEDLAELGLSEVKGISAKGEIYGEETE